MPSAVQQYRPIASIQGLAAGEPTRRFTDWRREVGDGRAEGSSAIGKRR